MKTPQKLLVAWLALGYNGRWPSSSCTYAGSLSDLANKAVKAIVVAAAGRPDQDRSLFHRHGEGRVQEAGWRTKGWRMAGSTNIAGSRSINRWENALGFIPAVSSESDYNLVLI
jgi:hypothetical protein